MLEPIGRKYRTTKEITYKDVIVPIGTLTDGISYKLRIFALFVDRYDPRFIEAVVVHDYLTYLGEWEKGNKYFEDMLPENWRKPFMVAGVKIYRKLKGY